MIDIRQAASPDEIKACREIFVEYEQWIGVSLCFQGFEKELAELPGTYTPPDGRLLLAYVGDQLAGCVALRKIDDATSEIKRLYVRESFRGTGLGGTLLQRILAEAKAAGYERVRLDSWRPKMVRAIEMYRSHRFYEIMPYNDNPYEMIYMEREL